MCKMGMIIEKYRIRYLIVGADLEYGDLYPCKIVSEALCEL
jgi:hypothetical protein